MAGAMNVSVRTGADARLLRAAVFSAVCVLLSAIGHELASGAGISFWATASAWCGVLCAAIPLAGRQRSLPVISGALLAGEFVLHVLFCLGQPTLPQHDSGPSAGLVATAQRLLCGVPASGLNSSEALHLLRDAGLSPAESMASMPGMTGGGHLMPTALMFTWPMLWAHLAAALLAGWVLRRGDVAVARILALPTKALSRLLLAAALVLHSAARMRDVIAWLREHERALLRLRECPTPRPRALLLHDAVIRRGPPQQPVTA